MQQHWRSEESCYSIYITKILVNDETWDQVLKNLIDEFGIIPIKNSTQVGRYGIYLKADVDDAIILKLVLESTEWIDD